MTPKATKSAPDPQAEVVVNLHTKALIDPDWDTRDLVKQQAVRGALDRLTQLVATATLGLSFYIRVEDNTVAANGTTPYHEYLVHVTIWRDVQHGTTDHNT